MPMSHDREIHAFAIMTADSYVHTHSRTAQEEPERSHAFSARSSASLRVGAEFALHGVARSRFSLPMASAPQ